MNRSARRQALLATARVAVGASVLVAGEGCESSPPEPRHVEMQRGAPSAPAQVDPPPPPPKQKTCDEVMASAFPTETTWVKRADVTPELSSCCAKRIEAAHHYDGQCCPVIDWQSAPPDVQRACSPWGPPVPPSMAWRPAATSSAEAAATSGSSTGTRPEA